MNNNRDFKGVWIPKEIWLNEELTLQEKVFLVEIDSLDNSEGCFATNQYFADFFKVSSRRARMIISSLIDKGYLKSTIIYKDDSKEVLKRILNVTSPGLWKESSGGIGIDVPEGYGRNVPGPGETSCHYNNTINNIIINNTNNNKKKKKESEFDLIINEYSNNEYLKNTIYEFIKMRKAIKAPMTSNALKLMLNKLNKLAADDNTRIKILEQSIMNSWKGIFELKDEGNNYGGFKPNIKPSENKWDQYDFE